MGEKLNPAEETMKPNNWNPEDAGWQDAEILRRHEEPTVEKPINNIPMPKKEDNA